MSGKYGQNSFYAVSFLFSDSLLGTIVVISWMLFIIITSASETVAVIGPLMLSFFSGAYIALNEKSVNLTIAGPIFFVLLVLVCLDTKMVGLSYIFRHVPFSYGPDFTVLQYRFLVFLSSLPFALIWLGHSKPTIPLRNDYSYGMYILGWPVQQMIIATIAPNTSLCHFMDYKTHCNAMFSWHMVEKRALIFKR